MTPAGRIAARLAPVLLAALAACSPFSETARRFATRNLGAIAVMCERFTFIVSLNDDDDDRDRRPDRRQDPVPASEEQPAPARLRPPRSA